MIHVFVQAWSFLRSILTICLFTFATAVGSVVGILVSFVPGRERAKRFQNKVMVAWVQVIFYLFRVRILVEGAENRPTGPAIYVFNHTSFFDIFALALVDETVRFGAKVELFRIPLFGTAIKLYGMLPIARQDRAKTIEVYEQARKNFLHGERYALAPEGTRNSVEELLPFKSGPFFFAQSAEVPIVPVVLQGAQTVWPKSKIFPVVPFFHRAPIRARVLKATSVERQREVGRKELQEEIREQMNQALISMKQESTLTRA